MIAVGLYELKIKETPDREPLKFLKRLTEVDINAIVPVIQYQIDGDSSPSAFEYDEVASKELGHYVYVRNGENASRLTPFNPSLSQSSADIASSSSATDST